MRLRSMTDIIRAIEKVEIPENLRRVSLHNGPEFLEFINSNLGYRIVLDDFEVIKPWAIVTLAAMATAGNERRIYLENNRTTSAARFVYALGLDEIILDKDGIGKVEENRTVKLCRIIEYEKIESVADQIAKLVIPLDQPNDNNEESEAEDVRLTIKYVLIELIRNVIQHSNDKEGALVLAQRMNKGIYDDEDSYIQIAVSDRGIGILEALKENRKDVNDPLVALDRSLQPGYSGKFPEFQTGSSQNAGMGLFFVSEIAKRTAGKFFIASKGASLIIKGDPEFKGNTKINSFTNGFDGTLVVFEMPKAGVNDYNSLIRHIRKIATERREKRFSSHWIRFDIPKKDILEFVINITAENTVKAEQFAKNELLPRIRNKQSLLLNFVQFQICTQSFIHALLHEVVKLAFQLKVPVYVKNTSPSVRDEIKLLERYSLFDKDS